MSTFYTAHHRRKRNLALLFSFIVLAFGYSHAQTTLISPTGAGGFELGSGSFADNGWTVITSATNNWFTGQGKTNGAYSFPTTSRCAYISNDAGASWAYSGSTNQSVHFYRDVVFPAGETQATLSFKFQQRGDNARLMVFICDPAMTPVVGEPNSGSINVTAGIWGGTGTPTMLTNTYTLQAAGTVTYTISIPPASLGNCASAQTRRIVFTWNNSTTPAVPPAAVDEIALVSRTPVAATAGTFTINNTQATGGTNFNNFTDAVSWANAAAYCGLSNPVTINVSAGQVFTEDAPALRAVATAASPITFQKSGAGANPQIRPLGTGPSVAQNPGTVDFGMALLGARYVTIDGIDIKATNANIEFGYFVGVASETQGSSYNTIKNTTITLDRTNTSSKGILQSASNLSALGAGINPAAATSTSGTNSNNRYYNLTISNVYSGVVLYGSSTNLPDVNNRIGVTATGIFNTIGLPEVPNDVGNGSTAGTVGINAQNQQNIAIFNNKISNVTGSGSNPIEGISLGAYSSSTATWNGIGGYENEIYNNIITNIRNTSTTAAGMAAGIRLLHDPVLGMVKVKVYNNVINKISSAYTGTATASRGLRAIHLQSNSAVATTVIYELVNNTAVIDGSSSPNVSSTVLDAQYNGAVFVIRNNLFANKTGAQSGSAIHTVLGIQGATTAFGASGSISNYNNFYLANTTNGYLSFQGNIPTLAAWRATYPSPAIDVNSISSDPLLNSDEVLFPLYSSPLVKACPSLSTPYDVDVLGNRRNATQSTIGAFEKAGDIIAPLIKDTTLLGTTSLVNRALSDLLYITDGGSIVETNQGAAPRIYFKKPTDANVFGANNSTTNGWKWVEAQNITSPFGFNIDYSLLQSAVAVHDVIEYFFVAQDTVLVPNVAAVPAQGFAGTSVSSITSAPAVPKRYVIYDSPAPFVDATVSQGSTAKVITGTTNQQIIRVAVQTGATGDSAYVSELVFNSSGINDFANIANASVWYTGTNGVFGATKQFGQTLNFTSGSGALGNFTVNGAQVIPPNSTSYFWLTYDIKENAIAFDQVDAELVSLVYNNSYQTPSVSTAAGSRTIKTAYCVPQASQANYGITKVVFNTLNNTTTLAAAPAYTNYTPSGATTTVVKKGIQYNLSITTNNSNAAVAVFIDYNDNGVFDPNETVASAPFTTDGVATILPVTIPCTATASTEIRMRVRGFYYSNVTNGCTTNTPSETEDYTITIQDNPAAYTYSAASQVQGTASAGAINRVLMNVAVVAGGCGSGNLTSLYANTIGTTSAGDILNAKLYSTGNNKLFNTSNLLATVSAPSGLFQFTGLNDNLLLAPGDTNNYWITYDLAGSATLNNLIDMRVDSIGLIGEYKIPANNSPAANLVITNSNTYVNSSAIHPAIARVPRIGQPSSPVMRIRIVTTNSGAPLQVTQFDLSTVAAGNDTANIQNAKLYYTGNTNAFSTQTLFGNGYAPVAPTVPAWSPYSINGVQQLNYDTNYFWLAYDIKPGAVIGDFVDAELISFVLNGATQSPTTSSLAGNYAIEPGYCTVSYSNFSNIPPTQREEITRVVLGTLDNSSTCAQTGGIGSELNIYSNYSDIVAPVNIRKNEATAFALTGVSNCGSTTTTNGTVFSIYIDLNKDGDFTDNGENIYRSASAAGVLTGRTQNGSITIPCTASLGLTRMRIIYSGSTPQAPPTAACGVLGQYGEAEDYTINILDNPASYDMSLASQTSQTAAPGTTGLVAMRIAVKAKGCGTTPLSALYFNTTGSTNAAGDIASAEVFTTGTSSQYANATYVGTATVSSNQLAFTGLGNTLQNNSSADSNYFWLLLHLSSSATTANIIDVALDSVNASGSIKVLTSAQGNPAGNIKIAGKMSFIAASAIHPDLSSVSMGTKNKQLLRILVRGSANSAPVTLSDLQFSTAGGGNDLSNIDSARVYFTGKSAVFSTATPFGLGYVGTTNPWGTFTISGNQVLTADTSYFWLAYDIKSTATLFDSVDATLESLTFDGTYQNASVSPAGVVNIKYDYCSSVGFSAISPSFGNAGYNITTVRVNTLNNVSACAPATTYGNHTALSPVNITKGTVTPFKIKATYCGSSLIAPSIPTGYITIYIDYDQSGNFTPNEVAYTGNVITADTLLGNLLIPCGAKAGQTRMRVILSSNTALMAPCGTSNATIGYGETEDYTINITDAVLAHASSSASQKSGLVGLGMNDEVMMQLKISTMGCGTGELTKIYLNTAGSSNPAGDLIAAKLYKTSDSITFNTSTLLGTYFGPVGQFDISLTDVLQAENHYWITYDISGSAAINNTADVRLDSILMIGQHYIPANNNPSQVKTINAPMTFVDASASHNGNDRAAKGNSIALLNVKVNTTSGSPLSLTSVNLNSIGGGVDTANILSAKLYYTGNSNVFAATSQFGATYTPGTAVTGAKWNPFSFTGNLPLAAGTNNFWLVYQLKGTAVSGDSVDAQLVSVTVNNVVQTPTNGNPSGNVVIRDEYCVPGIISGRCIDNVTIGGINHASGSSCAQPFYTLFPASGSTTTSLTAGSSVPVHLTFPQATRVSIFIDLNRNGIFETSEEYNIAPQVNVSDITTSIFIPATALLGETRLRIRTFGGQSTGTVTNRACNDWNNSSTHDYTVTILPAIPPTTYVWNQTAAASFIVASNWTPARTSASPTDRLVFPASSTPLVVNNLSAQTVSTIEIAPNTKVMMNAPAASTIAISDSLILGFETQLLTSNNITVQVGETSGKPGTLILDYNAGINSKITRFIGPANNATDILFPIVTGKGVKKVKLNYGGNSVFGAVTVSFVSTNPAGSGGLPLYEASQGVTVNKISDFGYWDIVPSPDVANSLYMASFEIDSIGGVLAPYALVLVNRIDMFNNWTLNGNYAAAFGTNDRVELSRTSMYGYGQFAIGSDEQFNPLPVQWLSFTGIKAYTNSMLSWTTASETNNNGFEVLRSADGKLFETIGFVKGNGNTAAVSTYNFTDIGAFDNKTTSTWFYRLKQVDNNNKASWSNTITIHNETSGISTPVVVFPNPFSSEVFVNVLAPQTGHVHIELFDVTGKKVRDEFKILAEGGNMIAVQNVSELNAGVYFIAITANGQRQVNKLIKQ